MMQEQICEPRQTQEQSPGLDGRIARLRCRRTALVQLIDSLTAYAEYAGQESDLTYACQVDDLSMQLPAKWSGPLF
jgi:hypothetical protein